MLHVFRNTEKSYEISRAASETFNAPRFGVAGSRSTSPPPYIGYTPACTRTRRYTECGRKGGRKRATFLLKKFFEIKIRLSRSTRTHTYTYTYTDSTRVHKGTFEELCSQQSYRRICFRGFESRILQSNLVMLKI